MRRGRHELYAEVAARWQAVLGPVYAGRANAARKSGISRNQQDQSSRAADIRQLARDACAIGCTEMPIDDGRAARQAPGCLRRIGRALWVGEEEEGRQRWCPHLAIETARQPR